MRWVVEPLKPTCTRPVATVAAIWYASSSAFRTLRDNEPPINGSGTAAPLPIAPAVKAAVPSLSLSSSDLHGGG